MTRKVRNMKEDNFCNNAAQEIGRERMEDREYWQKKIWAQKYAQNLLTMIINENKE